MLILLLTAALLSGAPENGRKSYWFTGTTDHYFVFIEVGSIVRHESKVRAWVAYVYDPKHRPSNGARATTTLQEWDCSTRKNRTLAVASYGAEFKILEHASSDTEVWQVVFPDSVGDLTLSRVCSGKGPSVGDVVQADSLEDLTARFTASLSLELR